MDALISLVYTIIDSVCVCLFLDAFASHRWRDHRFLVGVIVQTILMYASIEFSVIALNRNQIVKIFLILLSCFIVARTLYENISGRFLLFLIVVEYLLTYSLSFAVGSIDIAAAVRSVMFIGKLKHDPTMRILTHEKSSLAPPGASLAFSLGGRERFPLGR